MSKAFKIHNMFSKTGGKNQFVSNTKAGKVTKKYIKR